MCQFDMPSLICLLGKEGKEYHTTESYHAIECKVAMACTRKLPFYGTQSYLKGEGGYAKLPWHALESYHFMEHEVTMLRHNLQGKEYCTVESYHAMERKDNMAFTRKVP